TRTGRTVYAIGGSEQSAALMGLSVARTKLFIYLASGTLAGIAAVVYTARLGSAQNITGIGWELDAIAAAVIGGTLLTGGFGYVLGSVVGALVLGLMNVLITRDGGIPPEATTIITGAILLVFVLLQRAVISRQRDWRSPGRAGRWVPRPARRSLRPVVRPASPRRGADQSSLEQPARRPGQSIRQRVGATFLEPPQPSPSRLVALVLCWRLTRRPVPLTALGRRVTAGGRAAGRSVPGRSRAALVRCPAAFGLGAGVDRHVDAEGVAVLESTGEDRELLVPAVGEDVVALEGQPAEVLGRTGILLEL